MSKQTLISHGETTMAERAGEPSPFIVEFFMVQGLGFRCMAYCDSGGKWRSAFNHVELFGDIRILE